MKKEIIIQTVCGVGMGSSQFLKMQLDDIIQKLGITGVSTICGDLMTCQATVCDAIFTQPQLAETIEETASVPVLTLTNYTDKQAITKILLHFLDNMKQERS